MDELVSIIIPVYNVKDYLETCVASIVTQTYRNLEIILVDDGSTDGSGDICDQLKNKDNRIKVIHKTNGGLSDARNSGIDHATGGWLSFVDSDDFVSCDYVERLLGAAHVNHAEISICDPVHITKADDAVFTKESKVKVFSNTEAIQEMWYQKSFLFSAWAKIYRRELFNDIRYTKGIIYEDVDVMHEVFALASQIVYIDAKLYAYVHREGSITTQKFSAKEFDILKICDKLNTFAKTRSEDLQKAARAYSVVGNMRIFISAPRTDEYMAHIVRAENYIRNNCISVLFDRNTRFKTRIGIILFCINKNLFCYVHSKINRWS